MKLVPSAKRPCRLERGEIRRVPQDRTNLLVGYHVCCLRCGFNTPALAGEAMTVLCAAADVKAAERTRAREIFAAVGRVVEVAHEALLDAVTGLSGSGPAYVFLLIEALTQAAIGKGFTPEQARVLVNGTFLGASELLVSTGEDPAELRRRVTSPNGTTERAIAVLQEADLPDLFARATDAALARSRELAAGA